MSDDLLGRWTQGLVDEPEDPATYKAFHIARDAAPPLLDIRRADSTGELIPYRFLMRVSYTTLPNGSWLISLLCPSCTVTLEGHHLAELVRRLQTCEVTYLQEFDAKRWASIKDGVAQVKNIEFCSKS